MAQLFVKDDKYDKKGLLFESGNFEKAVPPKVYGAGFCMARKMAKKSS
ncbi:hypothetical protein [Candidatus Midichloria mitochondrii]|uniref:Uncharacterized protein n=1 Tax=Midichloria mitochondrii (strain IricVA) TaxID=696127 RepID=F7XX36_MIDMI|nr:hypothetical protein [Candidatus Midichloria mitochondrii]AEI89235.1 hypothetical protein midi_00954 [Candidatus Midichloria mitochondrii IricVA]MDJ1256861.1 hypothetical protein [Candidatus Midichloria mitochondrii]